jgi:hypothetical protein
MSDASLRIYERALQRDGLDPREIAAGLLGVEPGRFLILAPCLARDDAPLRFEVLHKHAFEARRMTGVWGDGSGGELWHGLHAFPVLTVYEQVGLLRLLNTRGQGCTLWDTASGSRASADGQPYLKVEEGWRDPRERLGGLMDRARLEYDRQRGDPNSGFTRNMERHLGSVPVRGTLTTTVGDRRATVLLGEQVYGVTSMVTGRAPVFLEPDGRLTIRDESRSAFVCGVGDYWRAEPGWEWPADGPAPEVFADVTLNNRVDLRVAADGSVEIFQRGDK